MNIFSKISKKFPLQVIGVAFVGILLFVLLIAKTSDRSINVTTYTLDFLVAFLATMLGVMTTFFFDGEAKTIQKKKDNKRSLALLATEVCDNFQNLKDIYPQIKKNPARQRISMADFISGMISELLSTEKYKAYLYSGGHHYLQTDDTFNAVMNIYSETNRVKSKWLVLSNTWISIKDEPQDQITVAQAQLDKGYESAVSVFGQVIETYQQELPIIMKELKANGVSYKVTNVKVDLTDESKLNEFLKVD